MPNKNHSSSGEALRRGAFLLQVERIEKVRDIIAARPGELIKLAVHYAAEGPADSFATLLLSAGLDRYRFLKHDIGSATRLPYRAGLLYGAYLLSQSPGAPRIAEADGDALKRASSYLRTTDRICRKVIRQPRWYRERHRQIAAGGSWLPSVVMTTLDLHVQRELGQEGDPAAPEALRMGMTDALVYAAAYRSSLKTPLLIHPRNYEKAVQFASGKSKESVESFALPSRFAIATWLHASQQTYYFNDTATSPPIMGKPYLLEISPGKYVGMCEGTALEGKEKDVVKDYCLSAATTLGLLATRLVA